MLNAVCPVGASSRPADGPPTTGGAPHTQATQDACRVMGNALVRVQPRGRTSGPSDAPPGLAISVVAAASSSSTLHFTSFDLLAGAHVMLRQSAWDADTCVRKAILASHVASPIGRLIRANVPNWPTPQAIVSLGSRFYTYMPCVLVFQEEPHVPIVIEALPWETPAHLVRFAPPHMGLVSGVFCRVNGG